MSNASAPVGVSNDLRAIELNSGNELAKAKWYHDFYNTTMPYMNAAWGEMDTDFRFCYGDQSVWASYYGNLPLARRKDYNFNRILRIMNMIDGYQRRNRKSTIVTPVENGDMETADQFTKVLMWNDQQEGIPETISDAFRGSNITGMNLLHAYMDYRQDPVNGDIKVDRCSHSSFAIDPFFRKKDLTDCRGIIRRSYLSKDSIISLLPDSKTEINLMKSSLSYDDKFQFMPERYAADTRDLLAYDEFYYRDSRMQDLLVDTQTGETREWTGKDKEKLRLFLQTYPKVMLTRNEIPTVNLMILVQGMVLFDGRNPMGIDEFPFVPVLAYYNPELANYSLRVQGVVRGLRDSQYLYNRRKIIELDILESQLNSGFIYKEGTLVDDNDIFMTGSGKGLAVRHDANISDIVQIQSPAIPPTTLQVSESLGKEIESISGINEELLGSAIDDKAGILAMIRQGAGLTTLQGLFDNLDYAQKQLGRLRIKLIQANFTPGKIQRITEQDPTPQFYNKAFGKYDAAVEEGVNTTTQRQVQFATLLQLREAGIAIPDETLIEAMTVQNKKQLIEQVKANKQELAQMQQLQLDSELREQQSRTDLAQARTKADTGLGYERMSRIAENQALAEERRAQAIADIARAARDFDSVDINDIHKAVSVLQILRQQALAEKDTSVKQPSVTQTTPGKSTSKVKTPKVSGNVPLTKPSVKPAKSMPVKANDVAGSMKTGVAR